MANLGIQTVSCFHVWEAILKTSRILAGRPDATIFTSRWRAFRTFLLPFRSLSYIIFRYLSNDTNFIQIRYLSKKLWSKYRRVFGWCCPSIWTISLLLHAISIIRYERLDHRVWRLDGWTSSAQLSLSRIASGPEYHIFRTVTAVFS